MSDKARVFDAGVNIILRRRRLLLYHIFKHTARNFCGKIAVYDSSAFPRGFRSHRPLRKKTETNPKYEQTQNIIPKYEQTQNTKGFRSPRLQGVVYCNLAIFVLDIGPSIV